MKHESAPPAAEPTPAPEPSAPEASGEPPAEKKEE
jgi:hypothetical protein